jgi:hypothetical protein
MKRRLYLTLAAVGVLSFLVPVTARADHNAAPPACVVVDAPPLHLQLGYAPHGPEDCTRLP